jgi:3-deoxy-D-arabino-heptulosonate 7-phosphate (DAHP) synthase
VSVYEVAFHMVAMQNLIDNSVACPNIDLLLCESGIQTYMQSLENDANITAVGVWYLILNELCLVLASSYCTGCVMKCWLLVL